MFFLNKRGKQSLRLSHGAWIGFFVEKLIKKVIGVDFAEGCKGGYQ